MLWITHDKYTPEFYAAKLEVLHRHTRRSTFYMIAISVTAVTVQVLVNVAYMLCL